MEFKKKQTNLKEREVYESPIAVITLFGIEDIITTSGGNESQPGEWDWQ